MRRFKGEIFEYFFFILINEHRLNTEKMCGIKTLGHTLVFLVIIDNDWFKHHSPLSPNLMVLKKTRLPTYTLGVKKDQLNRYPTVNRVNTSIVVNFSANYILNNLYEVFATIFIDCRSCK